MIDSAQKKNSSSTILRDYLTKYAGKAARYLAVVLTVVLAITLRLSVIKWGVPTNDLPHSPYHPDESWAMAVLGQMNLLAGDFNPEEAHREGPLCYYIWGFVAYAMLHLGVITSLPYPNQPYDLNYQTVLIAGRCCTLIFDVLCCALVGQIVKKITGNFWAGLTAMLTLAITPYEMIHAHFLRTHIIANFFLALTIYLSFRMYAPGKYARKLFSAGICTGLCFASRYPTVAIGVVPCVSWLITSDVFSNGFSRIPARVVKVALTPISWLLPAGALIGAIVGTPFLFFDFKSAAPHLSLQASYIATEEFSVASLFNFARVWTYINYLIPYGALPILWLAFYASTIFLLFRPSNYKFTLPLLAFMIVYLYSMAKGYFAFPIFVRAAIPLFPIFAIFIGLAMSSVPIIIGRFGAKIIIGIASVIGLSTLAYDLAYLHAMEHDPRDMLASYLSENYRGNEIRVGVYCHPLNYFVSLPSLRALSSPRIIVDERPSHLGNHDIDLLLVAAFEHHERALFENRIDWLRNTKDYRHIKRFNAPLSFLGFSFDFTRNPHDLSYPLPALDLWAVKRRSPKAIPEDEEYHQITH
jgi:hypothetical protein